MLKKKNKTNKEKPLTEEELMAICNDAIRQSFRILIIAYDKDKKEFNLDKVKDLIEMTRKDYNKRRLDFDSIFNSLLEKEDITKLVGMMVEKNTFIRPATKEEIEEIDNKLSINWADLGKTMGEICRDIAIGFNKAFENKKESEDKQ